MYIASVRYDIECLGISVDRRTLSDLLNLKISKFCVTQC